MQRHWIAALLVLILIPQAFVFLAGALCRVWPGLLRGSVVYLVLYLALMAGGLVFWVWLMLQRKNSFKKVKQ